MQFYGIKFSKNYHSNSIELGSFSKTFYPVTIFFHTFSFKKASIREKHFAAKNSKTFLSEFYKEFYSWCGMVRIKGGKSWKIKQTIQNGNCRGIPTFCSFEGEAFNERLGIKRGRADGRVWVSTKKQCNSF